MELTFMGVNAHIFYSYLPLTARKPPGLTLSVVYIEAFLYADI
jgi:hypothetical protein